MSAALRLAGFAATLLMVFGVASLAGGAIGPDRHGDRAAHAAPMHGEAMSGHGAMAAMPVRGLAVSEGGLTLELAQRTAAPGRAMNLSFRITDADGATVRDFDVEHTKRMHFIVVRRDLTGFQHLHPMQAADGMWSVPLTLGEPGSYRVFADFAHAGADYTLADDIAVDGAVRSQPLPAPAGSVAVDGMRVRLTEGAGVAGRESGLSFAVTRHGEPVALEDYLGARGHLVALRDGDLAFLHVHPDADSLRFMATFPTAGRYRLFLQFSVDGRVHTAAVTQGVGR